jgi:opacity protein-like surface antigen
MLIRFTAATVSKFLVLFHNFCEVYMLRYTVAFSALASVLAISAPAAAQTYVSGSAGLLLKGDSDNAGALTRDFTTGDGVAVPAGTVLAEGTDIAWTTEFENGLFLAGAAGYRLNENLRFEFEISYDSTDVDSHADVTAGGGPIGAADAAVLITGSAPLGVTVADLVADGQGEVTTTGYAINAFYDLPLEGTDFTLYGGLGLGLAEVSVEYIPSGVAVINDDEMVGLFQIMAGASYPLGENLEGFGGYRYRVTEDAETEASLFPTTLDIENQSHVFELGVRLSF